MPNFRERIAGVFAAASSTGVALRVTGDTQDRIVIDAGGRISWGSGSAAADATIERSSTSVVRITNALVVDTAGTSAFSRTVVLKNSGQTSVSFGAFPWEWSTSLQLQSNDSSRWLWLNAGSNNGTYNSRIRAGNTGLDIYVGGTSANNGTHVLTAATSGRVGIGTTSPSYTLDVVGNVNISANGYYRFGSGDAEMGASGYSLVFRTYDGVSALLERVRITSNGNVGIGTSSPAVKLDVSDGAGWFRRTANGLQTALQLGRMDDGLTTPLYLVQTDDTNGDILRFYSNRWGSNVRFARSGPSGDRDMVWIDGGNGTGATISVFNASNTVTAQIHGAGNTYFNGGNVGIGTSSPGALLSVGTTLSNNVSATATFNGNLLAGAATSAVMVGYSGATIQGRSGTGLTANGNISINAFGGNVGIGTTSPAENLTVYANANSRAKVKILNDGTGASARSEFVVNAYGNSWGIGMGSAANNSNAFYIREDSNVADTQRFTIAVGGNVGIGTTSPASRLDVNGTISIQGATAMLRNGNYHVIHEPAGGAAIYLGNTTDQGNYYDNSWHYFRNRGGGTTYGTFGSAGLSVSGRLAVGTTITTTHSAVIAAGTAGSGLKAGLVTIGRSGTSYGVVGEGVRFTATNDSYQYDRNDFAAIIDFAAGGFNFRTAPVGTAGNTATFTSRMSITNAGAVTIPGSLTVSGTLTGSLTGNASTANTLAVSRNINGTAFNGSADITTANWGAARTLTVGNTGKSVNGGANVSWTISEIGAASKPELEAVLGDLMYVGTYDAKNLGPNTKPTPTWSGGNTVYRHGMYWVVSSPGYVSYFTPDGVSGETDLATREPANATNQEVRPGDWIICQNPSYDPQSPNATFSVGSAIFRFLSFSAENYVARAIADHAADTSDPHSAAGYLTNLTGDQRYAKLIHNHASDIEQALINHRAEADPHTQYLTLVEGNAAYASLTHLHDDRYERLGAVAAHVALTDPHPQYLTPAEGDAAYAPVVHNHDLLYYTKAQVDSAIATVPREVFSSDGAQSSRLFIGSVQPASPAVGDLWIETANISLQPPPAPATLTAVAPSSTTVTISWAAWATSVSQSSVAVQRRNGSDWTTVTPDTIFTDSSSPFDTSFTDTGRLEKTEYFYRVRAVNSAGNGEWGYVSIRTPNGAPGAPTSLTTSGITATQITLSWSAPSPFDGSNDGDKYEVFLNGVSRGFASGANTSFVFGSGAVGSSNPPLTERTTYTVGVRAKDAGDFNTGLNKLFSTIATTTAPTGNAAPPPPKSAAASGVTHNQATLSWAAGDPVVADGHPAGGISDFLRYRVYLNDVEITNTTNTSYTFTGLSPSTAYKLEVRAEDTLNSLSTDNAAGSFVNITTSANPDTTPPLAPTITSFQPVTAYGRMQVAITWPSAADTNFGEVVYYPGSGAAAITWTTSVTPGASITRNFYDQNAITEAAGQTPRVAVRARDSSGNWSSVTEATYTLIASPYVVAADSSNSWRNESGGRYNATGNFRLVQGYFSNAALNSTGLWYYGTKIADQIYNSGRRTVTNVEVYMRRNTGGSGSNQHVSIALHNELTNPGSVYTAGPTLYFPSPQTTPLQVTTGTGLAWNGGFEWCAITVAEWRAALVNGTNKGVAIRDADGVPYVILDSVAENGDSGRLRFTHLG